MKTFPTGFKSYPVGNFLSMGYFYFLLKDSYRIKKNIPWEKEILMDIIISCRKIFSINISSGIFSLLIPVDLHIVDL